MSIFYHLLTRELQSAWRNAASALLPAVFFLLSGSLLLYLGNLPFLGKVSGGYILLLLGLVLSLAGLYREDVVSGFLEVLDDARVPLLIYVYAKAAALWLVHAVSFLPVLLIYGVMAGLAWESLPFYLFASFWLLGGGVFLGSMTAAPLGYLNRGNFASGFSALLFLPLMLPLLIFAASGLRQQHVGLSASPHLLLLIGVTLLALAVCPLAGTKILTLARQRW